MSTPKLNFTVAKVSYALTKMKCYSIQNKYDQKKFKRQYWKLHCKSKTPAAIIDRRRGPNVLGARGVVGVYPTRSRRDRELYVCAPPAPARDALAHAFGLVLRSPRAKCVG